MDLFVTWEGQTGPGIEYVVEYRAYPSSDPFIVFATDVVNTYITIPGLADGFYEIRVKTDCADSDSDYIYQIAGKDPCPVLAFSSYEVISEDSLKQVLRVHFTNFTTTVQYKITDVSSSVVVINTTQYLGTNDYIEFEIPKVPGQTTTYKLEVANICNSTVFPFVNMGEYTVVGPPAEIISDLRMTADFVSTNNCAPGNYDWGLNPSTGTRITFAEPLPQAVTITFRWCHTNQNNNTLCHDEVQPPLIKRYYQVTIPAGTSSWAASHFRSPNTLASYVCILKVVPLILNNGKKLKFNQDTCPTFNPAISIANLNQFPYMPNPPCIS